eukprot:2711464-Amphidinium_carterae.1
MPLNSVHRQRARKSVSLPMQGSLVWHGTDWKLSRGLVSVCHATLRTCMTCDSVLLHDLTVMSVEEHA